MQDEQDAPSLTETEALAAARAVTTLFQKWELTDTEALDLLGGMTAETWSAWKAGRFGPVSTELGARLSHLIGVHKALRLIFSGDQARVYGWVRRDNAAFGGLPALVVMREEGPRVSCTSAFTWRTSCPAPTRAGSPRGTAPSGRGCAGSSGG